MRGRFVVTLAAALAITGCSNAVDGDPTASDGTGGSQPAPAPESGAQPPHSGNPTATPATPTDARGRPLPHSGAPKVDQPVEITAYVDAPCEALTPTQIDELKLPPFPYADSGPSDGPACMWKATDTGFSVKLTFITDDQAGLSGVYERRDSYGTLTKLPHVQGYPLVAYGQAGERKRGTCNAFLGVRDDLRIELRVQNPAGTKDPCSTTQRVAGMLVTNFLS